MVAMNAKLTRSDKREKPMTRKVERVGYTRPEDISPLKTTCGAPGLSPSEFYVLAPPGDARAERALVTLS